MTSSFVLTDDVYSKLCEKPHKMEAFADAYEVDMEEMRKAYNLRLEADKAFNIAQEKQERIVAKSSLFDKFCEEFSGYDIPGSLIRLLEKGRDLAADLSDDDSVVSVGFSLGFNDDGEVVLSHSLSGVGDDAKAAPGGGGKRRVFDYYHSGAKLDGRLKPFVLENYPESAAAREIRDYDPKMGGTKKGSKSAFDCIQDDKVLVSYFTRVERA